MSEPADPSGTRRRWTGLPILLERTRESLESTTENFRCSVLYLLELSPKGFSEADRYTRIGRVYQWPDRCYSGVAQRHISAEVCKPEGGGTCDRITFFLCLRRKRETTNSIA